MTTATKPKRLRLTRRVDGWWITDDLPDGDPDCGPYDTRRDADDIRRGLERTARYGHRHDFWTTEKKRP